jgi:PTS system ascorbate-specific IIA component
MCTGMIGVLIMAHDRLGESLADAVTHVLGARPPQFDVFPVESDDDPLTLLPKARDAVAALDTGDGVAILSDIYGATPCNLAVKLAQAGHVEVLAGVSLPMLVRAFTYRTKGMETFVKKAVSGGCEGVLHVEADRIYAPARSRDR